MARTVIKIGVRGGKIVSEKARGGKMARQYLSSSAPGTSGPATTTDDDGNVYEDEPTFELVPELAFGDTLTTPAGVPVVVTTQGYLSDGYLWDSLEALKHHLEPGSVAGWKSWFHWKGNPAPAPVAAAPEPQAAHLEDAPEQVDPTAGAEGIKTVIKANLSGKASPYQIADVLAATMGALTLKQVKVLLYGLDGEGLLDSSSLPHNVSWSDAAFYLDAPAVLAAVMAEGDAGAKVAKSIGSLWAAIAYANLDAGVKVPAEVVQSLADWNAYWQAETAGVVPASEGPAGSIPQIVPLKAATWTHADMEVLKDGWKSVAYSFHNADTIPHAFNGKPLSDAEKAQIQQAYEVAKASDPNLAYFSPIEKNGQFGVVAAKTLQDATLAFVAALPPGATPPAQAEPVPQKLIFSEYNGATWKQVDTELEADGWAVTQSAFSTQTPPEKFQGEVLTEAELAQIATVVNAYMAKYGDGYATLSLIKKDGLFGVTAAKQNKLDGPDYVVALPAASPAPVAAPATEGTKPHASGWDAWKATHPGWKVIEGSGQPIDAIKAAGYYWAQKAEGGNAAWYPDTDGMFADFLADHGVVVAPEQKVALEMMLAAASAGGKSVTYATLIQKGKQYGLMVKYNGGGHVIVIPPDQGAPEAPEPGAAPAAEVAAKYDVKVIPAGETLASGVVAANGLVATNQLPLDPDVDGMPSNFYSGKFTDAELASLDAIYADAEQQGKVWMALPVKDKSGTLGLATISEYKGAITALFPKTPAGPAPVLGLAAGLWTMPQTQVAPTGSDQPTVQVAKAGTVSPDGKWLAPVALDWAALYEQAKQHTGSDKPMTSMVANTAGGTAGVMSWSSFKGKNAALAKWLTAWAKAEAPVLYGAITGPKKEYMHVGWDTNGNLILVNGSNIYGTPGGATFGQAHYVVPANPDVAQFQEVNVANLHVAPHQYSLDAEFQEVFGPGSTGKCMLVEPSSPHAFLPFKAVLAKVAETHGDVAAILAASDMQTAFAVDTGDVFMLSKTAGKAVHLKAPVPQVTHAKGAKTIKAPTPTVVGTHQFPAEMAGSEAAAKVLGDGFTAHLLSALAASNPVAKAAIVKWGKSKGVHYMPSTVYLSADGTKAAVPFDYVPGEAPQVVEFDLTGGAATAGGEKPKALKVTELPSLPGGDDDAGMTPLATATLGDGWTTVSKFDLKTSHPHYFRKAKKLMGDLWSMPYSFYLSADGSKVMFYDAAAGEVRVWQYGTGKGVPKAKPAAGGAAPAPAVALPPKPPAAPPKDVPKMPNGTALAPPKVFTLHNAPASQHAEVLAHGGADDSGYTELALWAKSNPEVWAHVKEHAAKATGENAKAFAHLLKQNGTMVRHLKQGGLMLVNYSQFAGKLGGGRMAVMALADDSAAKPAPVEVVEPKGPPPPPEPKIAVPEKVTLDKTIGTAKTKWGDPAEMQTRALALGLDTAGYAAKVAEYKAAHPNVDPKTLRFIARNHAAARIAADLGMDELARTLLKEYRTEAYIAADALGLGVAGYFNGLTTASLTNTGDWDSVVMSLRKSQSQRSQFEMELANHATEFKAAASKQPPDVEGMRKAAVRMIKRRDALAEAAKAGYIAEANMTADEVKGLHASTQTPPPLSIGVHHNFPGVDYQTPASFVPDGKSRQQDTSLVSALKAAAAKQQATFNSAEKSIISNYTGLTYDSLNAFLRGIGESGDVAMRNAQVNNMTTAISKAAMPREAVVWRGVPTDVYNTLKAALLEHGECSDNGFLSASTSPSFAASWKHNGVVIEMKVPAGYPATYVAGSLSKYGHEGELILQRGTRLRLVGVKSGQDVGGYTCEVLQVEVVPAEHAGVQTHEIAALAA